MKKIICTAAVLAMLCAALTACGSQTETSDNSATVPETTVAAETESQEETSEETETSEPDEQKTGIDYLALVNKCSALPDNWEDNIETVKFTNSVGDEVEVEKKAYDAYLELKAELEEEGVYVDLDSAFRSIAEQQRIMDDFTRDYGADYAAKTVAKPGYSEHHTGLALDLYLIIDGEDIVLNDDMMKHPDIWEKIHAKLADHGFILRYLKDKEHITGYGYEPWHIRYLDDVDKAKEITSKGITYEEYLGTAKDELKTIDLGSSALLSEDEMNEAAIQVKCSSAGFDGCTLTALKYAGDETNNEENLKKANEHNEKSNYVEAIKFLTDITVSKTGDQFDETGDKKDYPCLLAHKEGKGWEVVCWGE